jgi:hypothetical protein
MSLIVCNLPVVVAASIDLRERNEPKGSSFLSSYMRFTSLMSAEKAAHSHAAQATTTITLNTVGHDSMMLHKSPSYATEDVENLTPDNDHKQLPTPATGQSMSFSVV